MPKPPLTALHIDINKVLSAKLRFIARHKERLIAAWVAETGLLPSESELVIQDHGNGMTTARVRKFVPTVTVAERPEGE